MLKEYRELAKLAAQEVGELAEQQAPAGQVNVVGNVTNVRMTLDELKRLPPEELRRRHREALRLPLPD